MKNSRTLFYGALVLMALALVFYKKFDHNRERGNGKISQKEISMPEFSKVELGGTIEAVMRQSDSYRIVIHTDDNLLKYIHAEVVNGTLEVEMERKLHYSNLKVEIFCPHLEEVETGGAVSFTVEGPWKGEKLAIDMSGGTKLHMMELDLTDLETDISGASEVQLGGKVSKATFDMSGACEIKAAELIAQQVEISVSGAASARVHAESNLDVDISGAGSVIYTGNPVITKDISGAGSIEQAK